MFLPLEKVTSEHFRMVGAKAYNLSKIVSLANVSPAVCLTSNFCVPVSIRLQESSWSNTAKDSSGFEFSEEEIETVSEAIARFGTKPFSIRSSYVGEDGQSASFAGVFKSILNVSGVSSAIDALVDVIGSGATEQVRRYTARHGVTPPVPAVLIQEMVEPDVAGVMLTASPFASEDYALIEASYGLGESVVGGSVTPDLITVSRDSQQVVTRECGSKQWAVRSRIDGGVEVGPVSADQRTQICLSDRQAEELIRTGLALEKAFGMAQDVEWAYKDERLWILQSRPITAFISSSPA